MALERLQRLPRPGVPQLDRLVVRCRCQRLTVQREGYGVHQSRMALQRLQTGVPIF